MKILTYQKQISRKKHIQISIFGIISFVLVWSLSTYSGLIKPLFLPTPTVVIKSIIVLFRDFNLLKDIWISAYRILAGFVLGCIIAIPFGVLLGINKKMEAFFEPIIGFIRYIPPSAFIPLFILWFGIGDLEKILFVFIGVAPYLLILVFDVVCSVNQEFIEASYTLGAKSKDVIYKVIVLHSLPGIWNSMCLMIGVAWLFVVLAEIVGATSGLGHLIITSQRFLQTSNIIAAILIIGVIGILTDYFFKITYKWLFPWAPKVTDVRS